MLYPIPRPGITRLADNAIIAEFVGTALFQLLVGTSLRPVEVAAVFSAISKLVLQQLSCCIPAGVHHLFCDRPPLALVMWCRPVHAYVRTGGTLPITTRGTTAFCASF